MSGLSNGHKPKLINQRKSSDHEKVIKNDIMSKSMRKP